MKIRVVTDSGSDIAPALATDLGIIVVPLYIYFGKDAFRDNLDISQDELYRRLISGPVHPTTSQPSPADFVLHYEEVAKNADGIVSVHLSSKLSGTYNSAFQAKGMVKTSCPIEVVDSLSVSMGVGLVAMAAARAAKAGGTLKEVVSAANNAIDKTEILGLVDTLKYLLAGGRITKARATVGSILGVKPLMKLQEGELIQSGLARTYSKGVEKLLEFIKSTHNLKEIAVVYTNDQKPADQVMEFGKTLLPSESVYLSRLGPALGVHGGPGTLLVAISKA